MTWTINTDGGTVEVEPYNDRESAYISISQSGPDTLAPDVVCIDYQDMPAFVAALSAAYNACGQAFTISKEEADQLVASMRQIEQLLKEMGYGTEQKSRSF